MANELSTRQTSGLNLYAFLWLRDSSSNNGRVRDVANAAWDAFTGGDWGDYDITMSENLTSGVYFANLPAGLSLDRNYEVWVFQRAGGSPADSDTRLERYMLHAPQTRLATVEVAKGLTWHVRKGTAGFIADEVLTIQPGFSGTLAADFSAALAPGTGISTVDSVSDEASQSPAITLSNNAVSQDRMKAQFDVADITDNLNYRLKVTVTTTDGQTIPADCRLDGEETP